jgi:DNA-binding MarR family transcriptional regulator
MYLHENRLPGSPAAASIVAMAPDRVPTSACVCNSLRMATRAVTQLYDDTLRPSGLRVTQFSMLAALARNREANLRRLEQELALDQTTLTRSMARLERDGLVERAPAADGRVKPMRLTAAGRAALARARPFWNRAQEQVLGELGSRGWTDARRRLARLLDVGIRTRTARRARARRRRARPASA